MVTRIVVPISIGLACLGNPTIVHGQAAQPCRFVCSLGLNVEPTITIEPLFGAPRVSQAGGAPERVSREIVFETVFALDVPTTVPRLGFTLEAIVAPFGRTNQNPFTGVGSDTLAAEVRDNPVQIEAEINLVWLPGSRTGDWVESHFDIVDQFSPAEQPRARSVYTHKLNFELDTSLAFLKWLPDGHWLRDLELEGSLDYLATGLPRAGDELSGERFIDAASPWSFSFVFVIPIVKAH